MGFGDDGMSVKYGGSNSLTKLLQLIKSGFSTIGHTHTVLGDSTTKTVTVNANGVSECSSTASGNNSHAEGYNSTASGLNSHAEGGANTASGVNAHAEGGSTTASDTNAHAEGAYTKATKPASHAEGDSSEAIASNAHAEGYHAKASGDNSHAEGSYTIASTSNSHAEGAGTQASGAQSHAEGGSAKATGPQSHAEGGSTTASGINAHAEGGTTTASGVNAHSEGVFSNATASAAHAEGDHANAYHDNSHAEGSYTETGCANQHVAGKYNVATDDMAEVIGNGTGNDARSNARTLDWDGNAWFAGDVTATETIVDDDETTTVEHSLIGKADADHTHTVLGNDNTKTITVTDKGVAECEGRATGNYAHAEGYNSSASGYCSHAEGSSAWASEGSAHAEGSVTKAFGTASHAEGYYTTASGSYSHAEGYSVTASDTGSHAQGCYTATGDNYQHVAGKYNVATSGMAEVIGNGTGNNNRSNARTLDWDGNAWFAGEVSATEELTDADTGTTTPVTHNLTEKADRTGYTWGQAKGRFTWGSVRGLPSVDDSTTTVNLGLTKPGYGSTLDIETLNSDLDDIDAAFAAQALLNVPIGTVLDYAGNTVPTGYLECDGSAVSRTTYPKLFAAIGTLWGTGDGSTTFNLPNLGGRTAIGRGSRSVGNTGGSESESYTPNGSANGHTLTVNEIPSHSHTESIASWSSYKPATTSESGGWPSTMIYHERNTSGRSSTASTGGGKAHSHGFTGTAATISHMQPYAVMKKIIRAD